MPHKCWLEFGADVIKGQETPEEDVVRQIGSKPKSGYVGTAS